MENLYLFVRDSVGGCGGESNVDLIYKASCKGPLWEALAHLAIASHKGSKRLIAQEIREAAAISQIEPPSLTRYSWEGLQEQASQMAELILDKLGYKSNS